MNAKHNLEEEINRVLATWNPLAVSEFLAFEEYKYYASQIVSIGNDFDKLSDYLKKVAGEQLGLAYDDNNPKHRADIERVVKDLIRILKND